MQTLWSDDRVQAKDVCQVPKTQEWGQHWGGLKRNGERALLHSHTSTCIQIAEQISRCASLLQTLHHRIIWPSLLSEALYMTCSLCIGPIQFSCVCLFVIFMISSVLFIFHQANSPDLAHVHLAICKQSMIGCGLISRYWIFWCTNTLLLTKGQKHHKGLREYVCISAKGLYLPCWLNKTLTWMILSALFTYFDRKKIIFPVCNSHHQSFNLWSLRLFIYYRSYICSDMKKLLILASVLPCVHTCAV